MSPAVSAKQRAAMSIAEHSPEELYPRNKGLLKMSQNQLSDFASTKGLGAPKKQRNIPGGLTRPRNTKSGGLIPSNRPKLNGGGM